MTGETTEPPIDRAAIAMLAQGARLTYENAVALAHEAETLRATGALARTLALYQISLEECAKVETLGAWMTSILAGLPVDQDKILASLRSHKAKNYSNAYSLNVGEDERGARERGDWQAAGAAFDTVKRNFHAQSNYFKNAALYVDFTQGRFITPADVIDETTVAAIARFNAQYLVQAALFVRTFDALEQDPDGRQAFILEIFREAENAADPTQAIQAMMRVVKQSVARLSGKAQST